MARHYFAVRREDVLPIANGDQQQLLWAIALLALNTMEAAGWSRYRMPAGASACFDVDPVRGARMALAMDLIHVLSLAPQGRKALSDLGVQPLADEAKGPGG
jgi:hypothetical protein